MLVIIHQGTISSKSRYIRFNILKRESQVTELLFSGQRNLERNICRSIRHVNNHSSALLHASSTSILVSVTCWTYFTFDTMLVDERRKGEAPNPINDMKGHENSETKGRSMNIIN